jgi:hypothetical protein
MHQPGIDQSSLHDKKGVDTGAAPFGFVWPKCISPAPTSFGGFVWPKRASTAWSIQSDTGAEPLALFGQNAPNGIRQKNRETRRIFLVPECQ